MPKQEGSGVPAPFMCEPIGGFDVVSDEEWKAAREALLVEEMALMKAKDRLAAKRWRLPVTQIDRDYKFQGANGDVDLLGLFKGRRQLMSIASSMHPMSKTGRMALVAAARCLRIPSSIQPMLPPATQLSSSSPQRPSR